MRTGRMAAALRVMGKRRHFAGNVSEQVILQLVKTGKITVVESKVNQGSMMELRVPRNESPRRIYWDTDFLCYSYPLDKVSVKYHIVQEDLLT